MKSKLLILCGFLFIFNTSYAELITAEKQAQITPEQALERLIQGNQRFIKQKPLHRDFSYKRAVTASEGQFPHTLIFNCMDSRSNSAILFDQGLGNIFTSSIAGNVVDTDVIAGMEFAVAYAGSKLIVVMGHSKCGAIQAACKGIGTENIKKLTSKIQAAVKETAAKNCDQYETVDAIAKQNVLNQMADVLKQSAPISQLVKEKKIALIGAMHDLKTGNVKFFDASGKMMN